MQTVKLAILLIIAPLIISGVMASGLFHDQREAQLAEKSERSLEALMQADPKFATLISSIVNPKNISKAEQRKRYDAEVADLLTPRKSRAGLVSGPTAAEIREEKENPLTEAALKKKYAEEIAALMAPSASIPVENEAAGKAAALILGKDGSYKSGNARLEAAVERAEAAERRAQEAARRVEEAMKSDWQYL